MRAGRQLPHHRLDEPIEHPSDGTVVGDFAATASAGQVQSKLVTNTNSQYRYFAVMYKDNAGNWGHLASASLTYPRPKGASPLNASLVPAYKGCTAPNRVHGLPLDEPSCAPPGRQSGSLTLGTPDANGAVANSVSSALLRTITGDPPDRGRRGGRRHRHRPHRRALLADKHRMSLRPGLRLHRQAACDNDPEDHRQAQRRPQSEDGTTADTRLEIPFECAGTAGVGIGAHCAINSTMDALLPGAVVEGKRAIWQFGAIAVEDAGPNGTGYGAGCPSACGDGDETVFLRQGIFVP